MNKKYRIAFNSLSLLVTVISFLYVGKAVKKVVADQNLVQLFYDDIGVAPLSVLFFILAVVYSGFCWRLLFKLDLKVYRVISMYMSIWGLKYVPGQLGTTFGKVKWGYEHEIAESSIVKKIIIEHAFISISSLILSVPLIFVVSNYFELIENYLSNEHLAMLISLLLVLCLVGLVYGVSSAKSRLKTIITALWSPKKMFHFSVARYFNGIGFCLIVYDVFDYLPAPFVIVCAIYIFASLVGLLAFLVPGGFGVREATMLFLLGTCIGVPQDLVIKVTLLSRAYSLLADSITWLIGMFLTNIRSL